MADDKSKTGKADRARIIVDETLMSSRDRRSERGIRKALAPRMGRVPGSSFRPPVRYYARRIVDRHRDR